MLSIAVYLGSIMPIWLLLLVFIYKGKLYRKFLNLFRSPQGFHYSSISIPRDQPGTITATDQNFLSPQRIAAQPNVVFPEYKRPSRGEPGLKRYTTNKDTPFNTRRSQEVFAGHMSLTADSCKHKNSDGDLIFFHWSSQKQRMRQGQMQAGTEAPGSHDLSFSIPSAVTTGQIQAPALTPRRCLKCGSHVDPLSGGLTCDNCLNSDSPRGDEFAIMPHESCPNFDEVYRRPEFYSVRKLFKSSDFEHRYSVAVQPPVVDDEAELKRLGGFRAAKRRHRWIKRCTDIRKCRKSLLSPYHMAIAIHDLPAFQISLVTHNIAWCGLYLWTTTLVKRPSSTVPWDTSGFPHEFFMWENVFMWMITWDYCILLIAAQDPLR